MSSDAGWRPLEKPRRRLDLTSTRSPFGRLAVTHAFSVGGDTLLTIALAGSLFFSISPNAAKSRVALYLVLTMAPFAVVAPLIGPALDRTLGGRRLAVILVNAGRALLCLRMATDINSLLLFPEAFGVLVLSKGYAITKSALVPSAVDDHDSLVEKNSKLQLLSVAVGAAAAVPGSIILQLLDGGWVLRLAALVFAGGAVAAFRIPRAAASTPEERPAERAELRSAGILLAASAMGLLRGIVGFLTFLVAFGFRRDGAPSWWFGAVLAASMGGTLAGALVAPRLRRIVREERILLGALGAVLLAGLMAAWGASARVWAAVLASAVGLAASAGKLAFDSIVQRDAPDAARGRSFARFETRFQLIWVAGAILPVVIPIPMSPWGFLVIAGVSGFAGFSYVAGTRAVQQRAAGGTRPPGALPGRGSPRA